MKGRGGWVVLGRMRRRPRATRGVSSAASDGYKGQALDDAEISPDSIGYIKAHGTGTRLNDPLECRAIHRVFGDRSVKLPVSSSKSLFGHAMGASSALEALATLLAVQNDCAPPTLNCDDLDPECVIDPVPYNFRKVQIEAALSNSFAFGGSNAVLVFRKWKP